jgi:hypothetical protein
MRQPKKSTPQVDAIQPYLRGVAKHLIDTLYGPDGPPWGTSLTQIEDLLLEVRDRLAREMIDAALARQAQTHPDSPPDYHRCPSCQRPLPSEPSHPRLTQTRLGEAAWKEPQAYCDRCRRAFFPSVQEPAH